MLGFGFQVEGVGDQQPGVEHAGHLHVQHGDGTLDVEGVGQLALGDGVIEGAADLVRAVQVGFLLAGHERVGLGGELAFVEDNFKHAFPARISHGIVEHVNQQLAELAQRVGLVRAFRLLGEGFHGQTVPFGHGDEDIVLVLEMPVDRTTGDARLLGDVTQGRAGHPFLVKHALGGIDDLLAGFEGFRLGAPGHRLLLGRSWLRIHALFTIHTFLNVCILPSCFSIRF